MYKITSANLSIPYEFKFKTEEDADAFVIWLKTHGCIVWWDKEEIEDDDTVFEEGPESLAERNYGTLLEALKMEWHENRTWGNERFYNKLNIIRGDSIEIGILDAWLPSKIDPDDAGDIPDYVVELTEDIQRSDLMGYPVQIVEIANPLMLEELNERYDYLHYPADGIFTHLYRDMNPLLLHLQNFYEYIVIIKVLEDDPEHKKFFSLLGFVDISERLDYAEYPMEGQGEYTIMVFYKTMLGKQYLDLAMDIVAGVYEGE